MKRIERIEYEPPLGVDRKYPTFPPYRSLDAEFLFLCEAADEIGKALMPEWASRALWARDVPDASWIGDERQARALDIADQVESDPERPGMWIALVDYGWMPGFSTKEQAVAHWRESRPRILRDLSEWWRDRKQFERAAATARKAFRSGQLPAYLLDIETNKISSLPVETWDTYTGLDVFGLAIWTWTFEAQHEPPPNLIRIRGQAGCVVVRRDNLREWIAKYLGARKTAKFENRRGRPAQWKLALRDFIEAFPGILRKTNSEVEVAFRQSAYSTGCGPLPKLGKRAEIAREVGKIRRPNPAHR